MKKSQISLCLIAAVVVAFGCTTIERNPLEGWKMSRSQDKEKINPAIRDDYENYIKQLPHPKRSFISSIFLFENDAGQQAVQIAQGVNGTWWYHVLIYDKDHKRIKATKYKSGGYRS